MLCADSILTWMGVAVRGAWSFCGLLSYRDIGTIMMDLVFGCFFATLIGDGGLRETTQVVHTESLLSESRCPHLLLKLEPRSFHRNLLTMA